jgi:hypothetical protein
VLDQSSDVTAVVLTLGEATTDRAIDSLHQQTSPPHEIVIIRNVTPFHKALNEGALKVRTPFFIQVDADMILDPSCIAQLRRRVGRSTGMVVGHLRDALMREVVGVKLFRTACFANAKIPDSISPDTDFGLAIRSAGWKTVEIGKSRLGTIAGDPPTMGEHCPFYTVPYTFAKTLLEGNRYRYRRRMSRLRWHFEGLEESAHPFALVAQIGLSNGIFLAADRDLTASSVQSENLVQVQQFLPEATTEELDPIEVQLHESPAEMFEQYHRMGHELFQMGMS